MPGLTDLSFRRGQPGARMRASCDRDVPPGKPARVSSRDDEYTEYISARMMSLRRTAYLLCQDWHRADDLVQAAITKLYVHWGRARAADHIDAYARTVLVHEFIGERRSAWARRVRLDGQVTSASAGLADYDALLDLRAALAAVPPRQRAAITAAARSSGSCAAAATRRSAASPARATRDTGGPPGARPPRSTGTSPSGSITRSPGSTRATAGRWWANQAGTCPCTPGLSRRSRPASCSGLPSLR